MEDNIPASYKKQECCHSLTHGLTHSQAFTRLDVSYKKQECYPSLTHGLEHMGSLTHRLLPDLMYLIRSRNVILREHMGSLSFFMGSVLPILLVFCVVFYFIDLVVFYLCRVCPMLHCTFLFIAPTVFLTFI